MVDAAMAEPKKQFFADMFLEIGSGTGVGLW